MSRVVMVVATTLAALTVMWPAISLAEPHHHPGFHGPEGGAPGPGGMWRHERHDGRLGWWWVVGGVWTFYEQPVYPYPVPSAPPPPVVPAIVVPVVPVAPVQVPPTLQPQAPVWYYCDSPAGYYPYVSTCSVPFRPVSTKPQ